MNQHPRTLRLDPRLPLVWRTPTSMQLGVDAPVVSLDRITPGEERMLNALVTGVSLDGLRMIGERSGAPPRSVARLLRRVSPALVRQEHGAAAVGFTTTPLAGHTIAIGGGSPARAAVAGLLRQLGADPAPDRVAADESGAVSVDFAVIVSSWSTPPGEAATWLRRDIPHLDVVFSDTEVTIGPFVVPGVGACLHCRERHRIDRDPSWPAIAGQLYGRPAPTELPLTIARVLPVVAGMCVAQVWPVVAKMSPGAVTHLDAVTGEQRVSLQPVHPECVCRALPGTAMVLEPASDPTPSRQRREAAVVWRG